MMSNRFSAFTSSAALAVLVAGLLSPAAHGHGNNPPLPSDTKVTGDNPPPCGPLGPIRPNTGGGDPPHDTADALGPTWGPMNGGPEPPGFGLTSAILVGGAPLDPVVYPRTGIGSYDILPGAALDLGPAPSVQRVSSGGAVPTPGTLALLGLAALATRRRRRR
jgi:MYXO-CTERM domain-containing protein